MLFSVLTTPEFSPFRTSSESSVSSVRTWSSYLFQQVQLTQIHTFRKDSLYFMLLNRYMSWYLLQKDGKKEKHWLTLNAFLKGKAELSLLIFRSVLRHPPWPHCFLDSAEKKRSLGKKPHKHRSSLIPSALAENFVNSFLQNRQPWTELLQTLRVEKVQVWFTSSQYMTHNLQCYWLENFTSNWSIQIPTGSEHVWNNAQASFWNIYLLLEFPDILLPQLLVL